MVPTHTRTHSHTHTSGEKRISSIAGENPFIEFFFSLFFRESFSTFNNYFSLEFTKFYPKLCLSTHFRAIFRRDGVKNTFFPMTKGKFTWSFQIGLSFMGFFAISHYFSVASVALLTSMNKFPAKFCKV